MLRDKTIGEAHDKMKQLRVSLLTADEDSVSENLARLAYLVGSEDAHDWADGARLCQTWPNLQALIRRCLYVAGLAQALLDVDPADGNDDFDRPSREVILLSINPRVSHGCNDD